jgi:hypothetical protein
MPNVVIASNDPLSQSAKDWFIKFNGYVQGPPIDELEGNDTLLIIAHDNELKDGTPLIDFLIKEDFPMVPFVMRLIVCSAASMKWGRGLLSPAELIANHFRRTVFASTTIVNGIWSNTMGLAIFRGDWLAVTPDTDIISLMEKLHIHDKGMIK